MYSSIDEYAVNELKKELTMILRQRKREENRILRLLTAVFPEDKDKVFNAYDNVVVEEFDLKVDMIDKHIRIQVPKISHRKSGFICRLAYEDTLNRLLFDFFKKNQIQEITYASVIFEHMEKISERQRDNDNYNQSECKEIIDAMLFSGLIKRDNALNCSISHISTAINEDKPFTYVHIIDMECNEAIEREMEIKKHSFEVNKSYVTKLYND